jgi:hypothetical protein
MGGETGTLEEREPVAHSRMAHLAEAPYRAEFAGRGLADAAELVQHLGVLLCQRDPAGSFAGAAAHVVSHLAHPFLCCEGGGAPQASSMSRSIGVLVSTGGGTRIPSFLHQYSISSGVIESTVFLAHESALTAVPL